MDSRFEWHINTKGDICPPTASTKEEGLTEDPTVNRVIAKMVARSAEGMTKFGVTIGDFEGDTDYWIDQTIEELTDAAVYLERLRQNLKGIQDD